MCSLVVCLPELSPNALRRHGSDTLALTCKMIASLSPDFYPVIAVSEAIA